MRGVRARETPVCYHYYRQYQDNSLSWLHVNGWKFSLKKGKKESDGRRFSLPAHSLVLYYGAGNTCSVSEGICHLQPTVYLQDILCARVSLCLCKGSERPARVRAKQN